MFKFLEWLKKMITAIQPIMFFIKKNWKPIVFIGVLSYAFITTALYIRLNNLYNTSLASTNYLQGRIDTEMRDLKDSLDRANTNLEQHGRTIESQRVLIDQLESGKTKLSELNKRFEQSNKELSRINKRFEQSNNNLTNTNRELNATNQRLGQLIDNITGLQHDIESGNSDATDIARQCLEIIQQLEEALR